MTALDVNHWIERAQHHRDNDGGYLYESLAVEMVAKLGWEAPARLAHQVGNLADVTLAEGIPPVWLDRTLYRPGEPVTEAAAMLDCLGWAQAVLFAGWFRSLGNYRMVRDEFPTAQLSPCRVTATAAARRPPVTNLASRKGR